ncbi:hypothetical protein [Amphibacillus indicireducens]|uniref:Uncharacterized protein n=1 Tax=Amphibacillus indicireducens TaxID=1076330 RepID=A0ABP7VNE4_9BACI
MDLKELIEAAIQSPETNLLGIFIYLTLLMFFTVLFLTLILYLIPNPLSRRWKNAIIGSITFTVLIVWLYHFVIKQFI